MLLALDTETTGLDIHHGCLPFMVTGLSEDGEIRCWEWDVDPVTRVPLVPNKDKESITKYLRNQDLVFHNAKFDIRGLSRTHVLLPGWDNIDDTHIASHTLRSGGSHKLKDLALEYLDIPDDDQEELREACIKARTIGKRYGWRIAKENDPHWPAMKSPPKGKSGGDSWWAADMWMPRAVAKHDEYEESHPWWTVCSKYCATDCERTLGLWLMFKDAMEDEGLYDQYLQRRKLLRVTYAMEERGISFQRDRCKSVYKEYRDGSEHARKTALKIAYNKIDNLGSTKQLQGALFGTLKIPPAPESETKTGYSTDKDCVEWWLDNLNPRSRGHHFIRNLQAFRKQSKASEALESYLLGGLDVEGENEYCTLHGNLNVADTGTTRLASNMPNTQNISKKEGFNLRRVFGPLPGRVWYSMDYSNIELRIFAHACNDRRLIEAFEKGESVHLIIAQELYPKEMSLCEKKGWSFKKKYESTLYQWVKNGNFSLLYGAGQKKADATYHLPGAYKRIRKQFPSIDSFMETKYQEARQLGYVTCIGGYRLDVADDGPHKAVNYYVQGSAGWAMMLAMNASYDYLHPINNHYMNMTIHDELDFDFPIRKDNLKHVKELKRRMELSGQTLGMPLPVEVDRITHDWSSEEAVAI